MQTRRQHQSALQSVQTRLRRLTDVQQQRMQRLVRAFGDKGRQTMRMYDWVSRNAQLFKKPVYGPIGLEVKWL